MTIQARVWDPLYGRVALSQFEYDLISLPEIQRLRGIRMCNINSLLVTGASEISRFEHSIGVLRLAQEWVAHHLISTHEGLEIKAAALLHDMQTGPFGHSLQYVLEENEVDGEFKHDDLAHGAAHRYYQDIVAAATFAGRPFGAAQLLGAHWRAVSAMIKGQGEYGPLISGTMDLDNIDNVVRLAYHVGVADREDATIALSLVRDMDIESGRLQFGSHSIENIERWQNIRERLYDLLLLDWAEFSAKAMFTRAIEIAVSHRMLSASDWVHTDAELLNILERHGVGETQAVSELVKRLRVGDLYDPLMIRSSPSVEVYDAISLPATKLDLERKISEYAKVNFGLSLKLILHFILDKRKTRRSVLIKLRESGEEVSVGTDSKKLLIGVFVARGNVPDKHLPILQEYVCNILEQAGAKEIEGVADPMNQDVDDSSAIQLNLI